MVAVGHITEVDPTNPSSGKYISSSKVCLFGPIVDELMPFDRLSMCEMWSSREMGGDEGPFPNTKLFVICKVFVGGGICLIAREMFGG